MEMRAAASARPWVGPPRNDFRIGHDLVIQQEQGYIGELLKQVITNFPGQALPFLGIHGLRQLHVALVDEGILKIMSRPLLQYEVRIHSSVGRRPMMLDQM